MSQWQNIILVSVFLCVAIAEYLTGKVKRFNNDSNDNKLDIVGFLILATFTQPFIFWVAGKLGQNYAPQLKNSLADLPWYAMLGLLLIGDDMMQYWMHRLSHTPLLWPLHRPHHSAQYMSIRINYRNNFFYYLLMPSIWISGLLIYMGLGTAYLFYMVPKQLVAFGAHAALRWDAPLYKIRALAPVMWAVQRIVSTPCTHWAHHAMFNRDGIGYYKGNYAQLLFLWDIIFGSAHITQKFPEQAGLREDQLFGKEKWWVELFYPLFKSKREHTVYVPGGKPFDDPDDFVPSERAKAISST